MKRAVSSGVLLGALMLLGRGALPQAAPHAADLAGKAAAALAQLDLALADNGASGVHFLLRNRLSADRARRSLSVLVLDERGRYTRAGSEVRLYAAGTRTLLGTRLVDTGSGYCSQNAMPVHFGLRQDGPVDVEVTSLTGSGRKITRLAGVEPKSLAGKPLAARVPAP